MAVVSLADLSDVRFVEECCKALWSLRISLIEEEAAEKSKPNVPENARAACDLVCQRIKEVSDFASSRLQTLAERYGLTGTGNWMIDFQNEINEVQFFNTRRSFDSNVLKRYEAINSLRNIQATDNANGGGNLIERLLAGPDDVELNPREMALLAAHLRQPISLSQIQKEQQRTGESATQQRRNKLKLILDYNRGLKSAVTSQPETLTQPEQPKPKQSTERGDGQTKLIAALIAHHQYSDGSCQNPAPIGNNALA